MKERLFVKFMIVSNWNTNYISRGRIDFKWVLGGSRPTTSTRHATLHRKGMFQMMDMLTLNGNFENTLILFLTAIGVLITAIGVFRPILKEKQEKKRKEKKRPEETKAEPVYTYEKGPDELSQEEKDAPQQSPKT